MDATGDSSSVETTTDHGERDADDAHDADADRASLDDISAAWGTIDMVPPDDNAMSGGQDDEGIVLDLSAGHDDDREDGDETQNQNGE